MTAADHISNKYNIIEEIRSNIQEWCIRVYARINLTITKIFPFPRINIKKSTSKKKIKYFVEYTKITIHITINYITIYIITIIRIINWRNILIVRNLITIISGQIMIKKFMDYFNFIRLRTTNFVKSRTIRQYLL